MIAAHVPAAIVATAAEDYAAKQKFYDDVRAGNYAQAADEGAAYVAAHPGDVRFALDVAYAQISAGRRAQAIELLRTLAHAADPDVAHKAQAQLAVMEQPGSPPGAYTGTHGYAYAYSDYESRFADLFNGALVRYDLGPPAWAIPYVALHLTYDTRSGVPGVAQVYNDNAAATDAGLRFPLGVYGYGFAEGGYSFGLRGQESFPEDRFGFAYSRDFGNSGTPQPHALLDGSLVEYSRFQGNIIAYAQASYDVSAAQPPLRPIFGGSLAFDAHRLYYNNYAEAYAGWLVRASPVWNVRAVALTGTYLNRGFDLPENRSYRGFRILGVMGVNIP